MDSQQSRETKDLSDTISLPPAESERRVYQSTPACLLASLTNFDPIQEMSSVDALPQFPLAQDVTSIIEISTPKEHYRYQRSPTRNKSPVVAHSTGQEAHSSSVPPTTTDPVVKSEQPPSSFDAFGGRDQFKRLLENNPSVEQQNAASTSSSITSQAPPTAGQAQSKTSINQMPLQQHNTKTGHLPPTYNEQNDQNHASERQYVNKKSRGQYNNYQRGGRRGRSSGTRVYYNTRSNGSNMSMTASQNQTRSGHGERVAEQQRDLQSTYIPHPTRVHTYPGELNYTQGNQLPQQMQRQPPSIVPDLQFLRNQDNPLPQDRPLQRHPPSVVPDFSFLRNQGNQLRQDQSMQRQPTRVVTDGSTAYNAPAQVRQDQPMQRQPSSVLPDGSTTHYAPAQVRQDQPMQRQPSSVLPDGSITHNAQTQMSSNPHPQEVEDMNRFLLERLAVTEQRYQLLEETVWRLRNQNAEQMSNPVTADATIERRLEDIHRLLAERQNEMEIKCNRLEETVLRLANRPRRSGRRSTDSEGAGQENQSSSQSRRKRERGSRGSTNQPRMEVRENPAANRRSYHRNEGGEHTNQSVESETESFSEPSPSQYSIGSENADETRRNDRDRNNNHNQQRYRPRRNGNNGVMPKLPVFDAVSTSWESFKNMFDMRADSLMWAAEERFENMCLCLTGKAVDYYVKVRDQGKCRTYQDFIRQMDLRFSRREDPATIRLQFNHLKQLVDEPLEDWTERVMTKANEAFRGIDAAFIEQEMIMRFCSGSNDKEAAQFVMNSSPTSLEDALRRFKRYRENSLTIYGGSKRVRTMQKSQFRSASPSPSNRNNRPNRPQSPKSPQFQPRKEDATKGTDNKDDILTELVQQLVQQMKFRKSPRSPMTSPRRNGACFICQSVDHFAADCPKRGTCFICSSKDHYAVDCPNRKPGACYFCGSTEHKMDSCARWAPKKPDDEVTASGNENRSSPKSSARS